MNTAADLNSQQSEEPSGAAVTTTGIRLQQLETAALVSHQTPLRNLPKLDSGGGQEQSGRGDGGDAALGLLWGGGGGGPHILIGFSDPQRGATTERVHRDPDAENPSLTGPRPTRVLSEGESRPRPSSHNGVHLDSVLFPS